LSKVNHWSPTIEDPGLQVGRIHPKWHP